MYWFEGQEGLCQLLDHITDEVSNQQQQIKQQQRQSDIATATPLLRAAIDCQEWAKATSLGQGNWITAIYLVRLAVARYQFDFAIDCKSDVTINHRRYEADGN